MSELRRHHAGTEADMLALGETLKPQLSDGGVVYLSGELGVGKTTLVRGLLRAFGYAGRVKSPTYGLVESYAIDGFEAHHLDLYRLGHGEEMLYLGLDDLLSDNSLLLVEWPEKAEGWLPPPDWTIHITDTADGARQLAVQKKQSQPSRA